MSRSIFEDIKDFFVSGNMVNKLIVVNILAGLLFLLINILFGNSISGFSLNKYFLLSMDAIWDIRHPWIIITHLFVSGTLLHFIFNMLFLYWFGNIIGDFIGDKKILPLYILGGLSGAISYLILGYIFFPGSGYFIFGLDSIVISFAVASAVLVPDYELRLILIGNIRLKILVMIFVIIEFLFAISSYNPVYLSYAGSVIFGWYYIYSLKKGKDISGRFNEILKIISSVISKQKKNLTVTFKSGREKGKKDTNDIQYKNELNRILDKIKQEGYDNLSDEEKEFLFLASKRE